MDHPRTRGVYAYRRLPPPSDLGSSPHTRGLLAGPADPYPDTWIIPAHAGFTADPGRRAGSCQDHPRTRGVYLAVPVIHGLQAGSSPHTRGLLHTQFIAAILTRIIPAHAGFTYRVPPPAATSSGSSPHTRGLQPLLGGEPLDPGIIPAHAGFTRRPRRSRWRGRDHPRTRGVYRPPP